MNFKIKVMGRHPVVLPDPYYIEYGPREDNLWGLVHAHGTVAYFKTHPQAEKIAEFCGIRAPGMTDPTFNRVEILRAR